MNGAHRRRSTSKEKKIRKIMKFFFLLNLRLSWSKKTNMHTFLCFLSKPEEWKIKSFHFGTVCRSALFVSTFSNEPCPVCICIHFSKIYIGMVWQQGKANVAQGEFLRNEKKNVLFSKVVMIDQHTYTVVITLSLSHSLPSSPSHSSRIKSLKFKFCYSKCIDFCCSFQKWIVCNAWASYFWYRIRLEIIILSEISI